MSRLSAEKRYQPGTDSLYLCQVSESVSCGACCGLYNLPDLSRRKLEELLLERTQEFTSTPRTEQGIFTFQRKHRGPHRLTRPFPHFHHCPFTGLMGKRRSRVGCLLHPAAPGNDGKDYRHLSWYGEKACRTYFCPATRKLAPLHASLLLRCTDTWYDLGLIITEHKLISAYFREVERRLGRKVEEGDFSDNAEAEESLKQFVRLKSTWPHRRNDAPGPCNYFFDNGEYQRPEVHRAATDIPASPYEDLFRELDSGFFSVEELQAAELLVDSLFSQTCDAIQRQ